MPAIKKMVEHIAIILQELKKRISSLKSNIMSSFPTPDYKKAAVLNKISVVFTIIVFDFSGSHEAI